ncbi:MAG: competence/damage-inducible protein A [Candidatus Dormibacteraeota bacterium]|nr:competence/damage-inducible protein A [Candidatus Dormibacteraeota bacterium]
MPSTIVAIGNELLGGFTLDTNSNWLAQQLQRLGFPLKRITVVRDRHADIIEQLRRDLSDPEVEDIFCSGGLGPTPDDLTYEAIAAALGRQLIIWQPVLERIQRRAQRMHEAGLTDSPEVSEGNIRMARIPSAPDHVFRNRKGMAPAAMFRVDGRRLFVLPGVPMELKGIFTEEVETEFLAGRSGAVVRELRFSFAPESRFYQVMRELEGTHPHVSVGSYPNLESRELTIRLSGHDGAEVLEAADLLQSRAADMGYVPV